MTTDNHIKAFVELGSKLNCDTNTELSSVIQLAYVHNKWFDEVSVKFCLDAWKNALSEKNLIEWVSRYKFDNKTPKKVGIIMAGNIPMVGLHDLLSVLITNNIALVKTSSKDNILIQFIIKSLNDIDSNYSDRIILVDKLENQEAIIATGSNNTARYFESYFGKYPNIIRKNRTSIAVLKGDESENELQALHQDIFTYYGLGCRNISKIYLPETFNIEKLFEAAEPFEKVMDNNKYKNNYDYNCTLLLMNKTPFLTNNFLMLKESTDLVAPTATVHYEKYSDENDLSEKLNQLDLDSVQCISSNMEIKNSVNLGQSQKPMLWDYADNIDTIQFLLNLN